MIGHETDGATRWGDHGQHRGSEFGKKAVAGIASIAVAVAQDQLKGLMQTPEVLRTFIACCKSGDAGLHKAEAELQNALDRALRLCRRGKHHALFVRIRAELGEVMAAINGSDVAAAVQAINKLERSREELTAMGWIPRWKWRNHHETSDDD